ncbi:alpha/beta hydrolase [Cercophora scortea]|uniref:Alpha/beta hydrolase n=1 Tax=Cercophora scortea TaxID=314031 RepID=A0AAE0M2X4_9PEZI|nr:alpha/beta hydrolase [Cercophora scortea]
MSLETRNFFPTLQRNVTPTASGSQVVSYSSDLGNGGPVLALIHGYPQSAWRHVIPRLEGKVSLFVPELPGYGISTPATEHSKRFIGRALLDALQEVFGITPDAPRKVIVGGHDRGARVSHRLAVDRKDFLPAVDIVGTVLLDIVPTMVQWESFRNPAIAQGYFHWPLLANVELATNLIKAFGGANWVRGGHFRLTNSPEGIRRIKMEDAVEVYAALFEKEETIRCSCEDYAASATPDFNEQAADQAAGRKIDVPTLVMFSAAKLGSQMDIAEVWKDWVAPGTVYEHVAVGEGYGHYLPEEAYDIVSARVLEFLDKHAA